jgi:hypothetical protein
MNIISLIIFDFEQPFDADGLNKFNNLSLHSDGNDCTKIIVKYCFKFQTLLNKALLKL